MRQRQPRAIAGVRDPAHFCHGADGLAADPAPCRAGSAALSIIAGVTPGEAGPAHTASPKRPGPRRTGGGVRRRPTGGDPSQIDGATGQNRAVLQPALAHWCARPSAWPRTSWRRRVIAFTARTANARRALADFWFARNYDAERHFERIAGSRRGAAAQHVMSGTMDLNVRPPIDASKDWALVRLSSRACSRGVLRVRHAVERGDDRRGGGQAHRSGFVSSGFHPVETGLLTDPAAWRAASRPRIGPASPAILPIQPNLAAHLRHGRRLLRLTAVAGAPDGLEVVGINVGTYVRVKGADGGRADHEAPRSRHGRQYRRQQQRVCWQAGDLPASRDPGLAREIRPLQMALHLRDLYGGHVDGTYGAEPALGHRGLRRCARPASYRACNPGAAEALA